jgi:uncharacterized damage-inducible protein DinB
LTLVYDGLHMKIPVFCSLALLACGGLQAQDAKPMLSYLKTNYTQIKNNLVKAADKMSDADYNYQPNAQIRTFGALIAHIADAQMRFCGTANGHAVQPPAGSKTAKAELVAALKASFDECDAAFDGTTESNYLETVGQGKGAGPRMNQLLHTVIHDNEEYGYLSVYMRMKNIVPPSSDRM